MPIDQIENPFHQCLTLVVSERTQRTSLLKVALLVGVTARAAQRTLARDLD